MPDEFDPQLLRRFAQSREPLSDERLTAQTMALWHAARWRSRASAGAIFATVLAAVATGIRAPRRLRHAGLMALAAVVVTLCSAVLSL